MIGLLTKHHSYTYGAALPAFITPAVLNVLVEKFAIKPVTTVEADLKAALAGN